MAHARRNTALCDLAERYTHRCVRAYPQDVCQVPRNSLSLSIRVGRKIYYVRCLCIFLKLFYKSSLILLVLILRLKVVVNVNSELRLRQVTDMTYRCYYGIILSEIFLNCFRLRRRLNYYQMGQIFRLPFRAGNVPFQICLSNRLCVSTPRLTVGGSRRTLPAMCRFKFAFQTVCVLPTACVRRAALAAPF